MAFTLVNRLCVEIHYGRQGVIVDDSRIMESKITVRRAECVNTSASDRSDITDAGGRTTTSDERRARPNEGVERLCL